MNENINLCELLKEHEGETFYSPIYGDVTITFSGDGVLQMWSNKKVGNLLLAPNGHHFTHSEEGECLIFPSKDQRDWNIWSEKQKLSYESIVEKLYKDGFYYIDFDGNVCFSEFEDLLDAYDPNTAISKKQLEKLLAINKLMNVAKYLNGGWKPDWNDREVKYHLSVNANKFINIVGTYLNIASVYFKTKELAQQAIDILGEDTIRLALSTDW